MEIKYKVVLLIDVDFEDDVRTFLNSLDDLKYSIESITSMKSENQHGK